MPTGGSSTGAVEPRALAKTPRPSVTKTAVRLPVTKTALAKTGVGLLIMDLTVWGQATTGGTELARTAVTRWKRDSADQRAAVLAHAGNLKPSRPLGCLGGATSLDRVDGLEAWLRSLQASHVTDNPLYRRCADTIVPASVAKSGGDPPASAGHPKAEAEGVFPQAPQAPRLALKRARKV